MRSACAWECIGMTCTSRRIRLLNRLSRSRSLLCVSLVVSLGLGGSGCAEIAGSERQGSAVTQQGSGEPQVTLVDGTAAAAAVLTALNDPFLTLERLTNEIGVGAEAASAWIAFRRLQPFTEVGQIIYAPGVQPLDINRLAFWAWEHGYLPHGDAFLGTWDGVEFTVDAAERTLRLVNEADHTVLDHDIGLDSRAVESILAARPVHTIAELSTLFWVGPEAMMLLKNSALELVHGGATLR